MSVDINTVRGLITLALFILFIWLVIWAYSKKRVKTFNEAANLPFADENISAKSAVNTRTGDFS